MGTLTITKQQARRYILAHQGLWPPDELEGKAGVLEYIHRVGCIQFDPLNIVGRNPELVLQARVSGFQPMMLQDLLYKDRKLLDGWDKNMSIYCVEDWPYFHRRREAARRNPGRSPEPVRSILPQVRQELEERGPLSSIDLDFNQTVDWSWAPTRLARAALESMYWGGELVIHHKVNTRKVCDLTSRHLPEDLLSASDPHETEEQFHDWYVHRRIGGVGLLWNKSGDAWLGMPGIKSKERKAALSRLLKQGKLVEVCVDGLKLPLYMRREDETLLNKTLETSAPLSRAVIMAPLDNLLWDRRFVKELFDFHYVWEVYKPVAERRYGYYVLPILYGDRFIARFEPGQDKKNGALIIKQWWWEPGVKQSKGMHNNLIQCFRLFLNYLGADNLRVENAAIEQGELDWLASSA
ncbi:MAG: crosslink repair DNA glycosylase YcaQ family protein [Chloroflexota bacterium]|nr:crosslink repair DNA glycosylase YcaQ family protein [Chloroflexota bacterium]